MSESSKIMSERKLERFIYCIKFIYFSFLFTIHCIQMHVKGYVK